MARYSNTIPTNLTFEEFNAIVQTFMQREGFKLKNSKGNNVWQSGSGWLTAPQFIEITYLGNQIKIDAYLKYAILPGIWYVGEMGLKGFFGAIPKEALKSKITFLESQFQQTAYNKHEYMMQQQMYSQQQAQQQ